MPVVGGESAGAGAALLGARWALSALVTAVGLRATARCTGLSGPPHRVSAISTGARIEGANDAELLADSLDGLQGRP